MKREARLLLESAIDSLLLSIEHFNRPYDRGRVPSVLIMLDHSFEMLLKGAILHRGGRIREKGEPLTIGFDACVRKALSDGEIQFLSGEQALGLQAINGLRDAAQHHLCELSEQQLYFHAQSGVTLFRDILKAVFDQQLSDYFPARVLPISSATPVDLDIFFESEVEEIKKLLAPGKRRRTEANARLRPLAILDSNIQGSRLQPSERDLQHRGDALVEGKDWNTVFPGVASVTITTEGEGPSVSLRFTKKEGLPIQAVQQGTPGAMAVGIKRVNELDYYNLSHKQVAEKVGLTSPQTTAVINYSELKADPEYFKEIILGKSRFGRYSQKAIPRIKEVIGQKSIEEIWSTHRPGLKVKN